MSDNPCKNGDLACGQGYWDCGKCTKERHRLAYSRLTPQQIADFAASFQRAAVTALLRKLKTALDRYNVSTLLVGGGVSANSRLRSELTELADKRNLDLRLPEMQYCMDNAAMIAGLASEKFKAKAFDDWSLTASPRMQPTVAGRIEA